VNENGEITRIILDQYPATQAIYLFGAHGTADEWPDSDVDIAVLLPPVEAKRTGLMVMDEARVALERMFHKDVDLINLRLVSTVFQKEIVFTGRRIYCADVYAAAEFEMLVLSFYQRLKEQTREILDEFRKTKRAYPV
jgi:predicted nucleotidyltransferase